MAPTSNLTKLRLSAQADNLSALKPAPVRPAFDRFKVECCNCHKHGHIAKECQQPKTGSGKVTGK